MIGYMNIFFKQYKVNEHISNRQTKQQLYKLSIYAYSRLKVKISLLSKHSYTYLPSFFSVNIESKLSKPINFAILGRTKFSFK